MKLLSFSKTKLILVVFVAAIMLGSGIARADFGFGKPTNLGPIVNSLSADYDPCISADGLEFFFITNRPGGVGGYDLYVASRTNTSEAWMTIENLGSVVNSNDNEGGPSISADGLSLYFVSDRPGGLGNKDLYITTRTSTVDPWGEPENLGSVVNSTAHESVPSISFDGLELYFSDHARPPYRADGLGGQDLWMTTRTSVDEQWATPTNLGPEVSTSTWEGGPSISSDGLVLFFHRWRGIGNDDWDIYMARRETKNDPWTEVTNLGPGLNTPDKESNPCISADGCTLYFVSMREGSVGDNDLWQVPIVPICDFNGDIKIDTDDLLIMMDNWSTDESLCDIGPMPWGDGVVDIEDLTVFIEYWEQENMPQDSEE